MSTLDRKKAQAATDGKLAEPDCRPTVNVSWTDERERELARLWAEGHSASRIAKMMGGITRNAVIGKVHRLGLKGRAAPANPARLKLVKPKAEKKPKAQRGKKNTGKAAFAPVYRASKPEDIAPPQKHHAARMAEPERAGVPIMALGACQCRWPVNDARRGEDHLFCGDKTEPGRTYCAAHKARATRLTLRPEEA